MTLGQWIMLVAILASCLLLILVVLIQRGRGEGLAGAFGGGGSSAFGAKTGDVFTGITVALACVFLLLTVFGNYVFQPPAVATPPAATAASTPTPIPVQPATPPAPATPGAGTTATPPAPVPATPASPAGEPADAAEGDTGTPDGDAPPTGDPESAGDAAPAAEPKPTAPKPATDDDAP